MTEIEISLELEFFACQVDGVAGSAGGAPGILWRSFLCRPDLGSA